MSVRTFASPATFAMFLGSLPVRIATEKAHALDQAARMIQDEAKAEIGHYQGAASPFVPWAPLAESTVEDRVRQGFTPDDPGLRTGDMRDSIQRKVAGDEAEIGSDEEKMVYFELGTRKQPPRSALGGAAVRKGDEVAQVLGRHFIATLVGPGVRIPIRGED